MTYPGMYHFKSTDIFSQVESTIQAKIDSMGDLSQFNNCLDLPQDFNVDDEFSMETLNNIISSDEIPAVANRIALFGDDGSADEESPIVTNPEVQELSDLGYNQYKNTFNSTKGLGCSQGFGPMRFFVPDGFIGLYNTYQFENLWMLSISWTQSDNGFDYIFYETDNNTIKYSKTNQGFNYRLYRLPKGSTLYQGRKSTGYSFEWEIGLGYEICQNICSNLRGVRA